MNKIRVTECKQKVPCIICKRKCIHSKSLMAECPKYKCDRTGEGLWECESCAFIHKFIKDMYGKRIYFAVVQKLEEQKKVNV